MARLFLSPGGWFGTIGGFSRTNIFGTNLSERVAVSADADAAFDPSFSRGNDAIYFSASVSIYSASRVGANILLTADNGAFIGIPAGTAGIPLLFPDAVRTLAYNSLTDELLLGTQVITGTPAALDPPGGMFSIDIEGPSGNDPTQIDASAAAFTFTDDAAADTDVEIVGFSSDDVIEVTGATSDEYAFAVGSHNTDLLVTGGGGTNIILLEDVLDGMSVVTDYASAVTAVGYTFMTFG